ncbi:hypothetical protein CC86DRAFT_410781 [Ophiobolus disseminans]|uniref:Uncharacterized protein n=1 Tax=Ophiobolus disseminans TaxID=1469910 RepID=A0A6A6ZN64_9PLEO|nr:hypothetical protein CC86DRAFT_410781 [Ophiobolus disseminans]
MTPKKDHAQKKDQKKDQKKENDRQKALHDEERKQKEKMNGAHKARNKDFDKQLIDFNAELDRQEKARQKVEKEEEDKQRKQQQSGTLSAKRPHTGGDSQSPRPHECGKRAEMKKKVDCSIE